MKRLLDLREHAAVLWQLLRWTLLVVPVGILAGSASALFLWSLDRVTTLRFQQGWLLFLLPVAGVVVGWIYHRVGQSAAGGNNLIIEQIHVPGGGVPRRMAPLILGATLITHLFGGSAGREGTAVQMGGSLASAYGRLCRFGEENMRVLLMAGVAAGFGSVFGTPLTGAIFAMEVLVIGRMRYDALIPVLVASVVADTTCSAWGIAHAHYQITFDAASGGYLHLDGWLVAKVVLAAVAFGLVSRFFAELIHALQKGYERLIPIAWLRPALGGLLVIALVYLVGTRDYLGLSVSSPDPKAVTLLSVFQAGGATPWSWWWKLLFTVITLGAGFKGGEVTPLFFIGAALGNTLAVLLGAPVDLFAGLGFIAVFAGAANTPLACTIMGIELFGAHYAVYFALACFVAYFFSGHSGIYLSQRVGVAKRNGADLPPDISLRETREHERRTKE
ncbi:MAG: voltage-gated chloride channel family protein [Verrucomicrobia bacterium]|nr:voltage-gated chloride channel family protein [Verrucomicrobiota bacterium]